MKITKITGYKDQPIIKKQENYKEKQQPAIAKHKESTDSFVPSQRLKNLTYQKPANKTDVATIKRLKEESDRTYAQLKELVRQLLEQQGMSFRELLQLRGSDIDEETRLKAADMIGEGGPLHPDAVSDRIVEFAKSLSGGNKEKIALLRGAIEKGFKEAAKALGGELPDISKQTYGLVMEKLAAWEEE